MTQSLKDSSYTFMQGNFSLPAPADDLSEAGICEFYDSKITEAEHLAATLEARLREGDKGQSQNFWTVPSRIPCVSCATLPEEQRQRRQRPHLVDKVKLPPWHPLQLLSDMGTSNDLILTVSTTVANKSCPLYHKPNFLNHSGIPQSSQIRLELGEEGEIVFRSEHDEGIHPRTTHIEARKNGKKERLEAWDDYALCSHIDLVEHYTKAYKAAKMEFLAHLSSSAGEDA